MSAVPGCAPRPYPAITLLAVSDPLTLDRALTPGERWTVATTGGDVPAFTLALALPTPTTVTSPPALDAGGEIQLAADEALGLTWAPTPSRVVVIVQRNTNGSYTAERAFDGSSGRGAVPAEALPRGDAHVGVWVEEEARTQAGAFPVTARARWSTAQGARVVRGG